MFIQERRYTVMSMYARRACVGTPLPCCGRSTVSQSVRDYHLPGCAANIEDLSTNRVRIRSQDGVATNEEKAKAYVGRPIRRRDHVYAYEDNMFDE